MDSPWRLVSQLPDGPVSLVFAVVAADGSIMGAAPMPVPMPWLWRAGRLCLAYTGLRVTMTGGGRLDRGLICAVSARGRAYFPLWDVPLGDGEVLGRGDFITVGDGVIQISPAVTGAGSARELPPGTDGPQASTQ
jgi:hypothetical protein